MQEIKTALGNRIREIRTANGMTQAQLSEKADLSLKHLGELERGRGNPTLENLASLATALDISLAELFDLDYLRPTDKELADKLMNMVKEASVDQRKLVYRILTAITK
jgi:transcriptional regulator with XRE-family HTH domain